jgi:outer membrane protein assembly factor BamB
MRLRFVSASTACLAMLMATPGSAATSTNIQWLQDGGGPTHTNAAPGEHTLGASNAHSLSVKWRHAFPSYGDARLSPPVVGNSRVCATQFRTVFCLSQATGKLVWKYVAPGRVWANLAMYAGRLLVADGNGNVIALSTTSGAVVWKRTITHASLQTPTVVGSRAFLTDDNGVIYAISTSSGAVAWSYKGAILGAFDAGPTVGGSSVYVAVRRASRAQPGRNIRVLALAESNGVRLWESSVAYETLDVPMALDGGRLVIEDMSSYLYGVDAKTGKLLWTAPADATAHPDSASGGGCALATTGGVVYATSAGSGAYREGAYSTTDGHRLWSTDNQHCTSANLVAANGVAWYPVRNGIRALRPATGRAYATTGIDGFPDGLALVTGRMYVTVERLATHDYAVEMLSP